MKPTAVPLPRWTHSNWGRWLLTTGSGYGYMVSVLVTTALTTPAAIHFLGVREYGLWAIAGQLVAYVRMLDLGLSRSMQRLVAEAMAENNLEGCRRYTLLWVFCALMAGILFAIGFVMCTWGLHFLAVPPDLMGVGRTLFVGLLFLFCAAYIFAPCQGILYAQNRTYLSGLFDILNLWLTMGLFLFFLHRGFGLLSYLYATAISWPICLTVGLTSIFSGPPTPKFNFSVPSWPDVRSVFSFSGTIFANGVATQLQMTFPLLLITHYAGLAATGRFYLAWRLGTFLYQFILLPAESLMPRWQNIYIEGSLERLRHEFSETFIFMTQMGIVGAICFAAGLKPLLLVWIGPTMYAGTTLTMALSGYILVYSVFSFLSKPFILAKAYLEMTLPVLSEFFLILPVCIWIVQTKGTGPMMLVSVAGTAVLTIGYFCLRGPRLFNMRTFTETWTRRDFTHVIAQLAGLILVFVMILAMDRLGASLAFEFTAGILSSTAAIFLFGFSQWPRLKRIYFDRLNKRHGQAPLVPQVV